MKIVNKIIGDNASSNKNKYNTGVINTTKTKTKPTALGKTMEYTLRF